MTSLEKQILAHVWTACEMCQRKPSKADLVRITGRDGNDVGHAINAVHAAGYVARVKPRRAHADYRYEVTDLGRQLMRNIA